MTPEDMENLKGMNLAPYMYLATALIGKARQAGGNAFRHQLDTMTILIDYGYINPVLLKAAIIHDLIEDIPEYNRNAILSVDYESPKIYELVLEVSRREKESKAEFLTRIKETGTREAKILKCADRISNMISLGFVNDLHFIERYSAETEHYIYPIAEEVDQNMLFELKCLVKSRRKFLDLIETRRKFLNEERLTAP
jgi:(p)ppGpp synthase/HD superfamily hydrolase